MLLLATIGLLVAAKCESDNDCSADGLCTLLGACECAEGFFCSTGCREPFQNHKCEPSSYPAFSFNTSRAPHLDEAMLESGWPVKVQILNKPGQADALTAFKDLPELASSWNSCFTLSSNGSRRAVSLTLVSRSPSALDIVLSREADSDETTFTEEVITTIDPNCLLTPPKNQATIDCGAEPSWSCVGSLNKTNILILHISATQPAPVPTELSASPAKLIFASESSRAQTLNFIVAAAIAGLLTRNVIEPGALALESSLNCGDKPDFSELIVLNPTHFALSGDTAIGCIVADVVLIAGIAVAHQFIGSLASFRKQRYRAGLAAVAFPGGSILVAVFFTHALTCAATVVAFGDAKGSSAIGAAVLILAGVGLPWIAKYTASRHTLKLAGVRFCTDDAVLTENQTRIGCEKRIVGVAGPASLRFPSAAKRSRGGDNRDLRSTASAATTTAAPAADDEKRNSRFDAQSPAMTVPTSWTPEVGLGDSTVIQDDGEPSDDDFQQKSDPHVPTATGSSTSAQPLVEESAFNSSTVTVTKADQALSSELADGHLETYSPNTTTGTPHCLDESSSTASTAPADGEARLLTITEEAPPPRITHAAFRYFLLGRGEWVHSPNNADWLQQYRGIFSDFSQDKPWWLSLRCGAAVGAACIYGLSPGRDTFLDPFEMAPCGHVRLAVAGLHLCYFSLLVYHRPYRTENALLADGLVTLLLSLSQACFAIGFYTERPGSKLFTIGLIVLQLASVVFVAKCLVDVGVWWYVMRSNRIELLTQKAFEEWSHEQELQRALRAQSPDVRCGRFRKVSKSRQSSLKSNYPEEAEASTSLLGKEYTTDLPPLESVTLYRSPTSMTRSSHRTGQRPSVPANGVSRRFSKYGDEDAPCEMTEVRKTDSSEMRPGLVRSGYTFGDQEEPEDGTVRADRLESGMSIVQRSSSLQGTSRKSSDPARYVPSSRHSHHYVAHGTGGSPLLSRHSISSCHGGDLEFPSHTRIHEAAQFDARRQSSVLSSRSSFVPHRPNSRRSSHQTPGSPQATVLTLKDCRLPDSAFGQAFPSGPASTHSANFRRCSEVSLSSPNEAHSLPFFSPVTNGHSPMTPHSPHAARSPGAAVARRPSAFSHEDSSLENTIAVTSC
ncbi:hypothetical protein DIPPA_28620 [Diplonema papillatum]|nr:hypothetical protein DIPPA_28620 [Diplonema papillatum]